MNGQMRPILGVLAIAGAMGGCHRTTITSPLAIDNQAPDAQKDLEFWHALPGRSAISNNEGFHGLILLSEGQDASKTYEDRLAYARGKSWVSSSFDEPGDLAMQRGTLAKAISVANNIDGGVMMHLTNKSPRYATMELVYLHIMGDGSPQMILSGLDYVGVIGKVQDYVADRDARAARRGVNAPMPTQEGAAAPANESVPASGAGTDRPQRENEKSSTTPPAQSAPPSDTPPAKPKEPG